MRILVLNGPNLSMLGTREPEIYGSTTLPEIIADMRAHAAEGGHELLDFQTNHEGGAIDRLEQRDFDALIINPGAWTHYSYALRDALASLTCPVIEVHISDVTAREDFRKINVLTDVTTQQIAGSGPRGYLEAIDALA
ncbi:3-dehydroquinate dehydratase [Bowdeniella nasicola]|uniref:3-dehydroquinate dehydratase n=1 Tax=Bowdeniella nasicola TaxID=208480 RepID=A0A1Q5Q213_9ACTO|nr:type II 3-dehydroquinate dehydratase [Bowdeniella nasicola]OKL53894.1 3-dehydroquinate dehydratase [Bowdeniella nasicola]